MVSLAPEAALPVLLAPMGWTPELQRVPGMPAHLLSSRKLLKSLLLPSAFPCSQTHHLPSLVAAGITICHKTRPNGQNLSAAKAEDIKHVRLLRGYAIMTHY